MKTASKPVQEASKNETEQTTVGPASRSVIAAATATRKKAVAKPNAALPQKSARAQSRSPRTARAASETSKLVCRYCGSDDLAPSFRKRHDARCRACFKQRYGSLARNQASGMRRASAAK
jgi:hypothetical protein